jgi:carboxyl-terminal processing protease
MSRALRRLLPFFVALFACACLTYAAGFIAAFRTSYDPASYTLPRREPFAAFWEAWATTEEVFYGEVPSARERTYGAIHETLALLGDPYTAFVEPVERELEADRMRGSYGGIGVDLWRHPEGQVVMYPYEGSPAALAGIQREDVLLAVDGITLTAETTIDDVRALLHSEVGTPVTATISRPPLNPFEVRVERAQIRVPSVTWRYLTEERDLAYVRIQTFTERTHEELQETLGQLMETSIAGLVLDLRGNAGGLINSAVAVASEFIADGVVLYETGRDGEERVLSVQSGGVATKTPLAVLVDSGTASAAEILAGAIQDHERGPLIGARTFGKGSVQLIFSLSDGSSLHVTSKIWLTPDRRQIQGLGLAPDIEMSQTAGGPDEQLDRAVEYLRAQQAEGSN